MSLISLLITVIIICLVLGIAWWIVQQLPIPAPFVWVVRAIFGLIVLIILLSFLMGGFGDIGVGHIGLLGSGCR